MDKVQQFIRDNTHQLGYIMHEASRIWIELDPVGALTVGDCNFVVRKYGQYHELQDRIEELEKTLRQCKEKAKTINEEFGGGCYQAISIIEEIDEALDEEY